MPSFWSFSAIISLALIASNSPSSSASPQSMHVSTISAAPTILPGAPLVSAPLSPDMEPLFPSPAGVAYSPSDSSLPTIPSNPSPPNPDALATPGPAMAFPPSQSKPAYAPASHSSSLPLNLILLYLPLLVICLMQLHGM